MLQIDLVADPGGTSAEPAPVGSTYVAWLQVPRD